MEVEGREGSRERARKGKSLPLAKGNHTWCRKGLLDASQYHSCSIALFLLEQFLFSSGCSPYPLRPALGLQRRPWTGVRSSQHIVAPAALLPHPDHCTAPGLNGLHSFTKSGHRLWHSSVDYETPDAPLCQWPCRERHGQPLPRMSCQHLNSHPIYENIFSHGDVIEDCLLTAQAHASTAIHHECLL